jgi:hypothetical protein
LVGTEYVEKRVGTVVVVVEPDGLVGAVVVVPPGFEVDDGTYTMSLTTLPGSVRVSVLAGEVPFVECGFCFCVFFAGVLLASARETEATLESGSAAAFLWSGDAPNGER